MTGRVLVVWIPGPVKSVMRGAHGHWQAKAGARKAQREKTKWFVLTEITRESWSCRASDPKRITFVASVHNLMDDDNLRAALKATRDGLRDAGIIDDDSPRSGHRFEYVQEIDRKRPGVMVRVERAEGG